MLRSVILVATLALCTSICFAKPPKFSVTKDGLRIEGVGADRPIIYDNDFWTDVPDAAYLWAKASAGKCDLRGNIITRCTYGWENGYAHALKQQQEEAEKLYSLAQASGLTNVPRPVVGSTIALRKPDSGKVQDTSFERTAGSELIVAAARSATSEKPLLLFCGGSCTTVASAYLTDPSIADRMIVFQIDGGGYNGSDGWAWEITQKHCFFVNWARGYFWNDVSVWRPELFDALPRNALCDWLREYARNGLGKANQWGDGPWIYHLFDHRCLTAAEVYDGSAITVPRKATNVKAMEEEFIAALSDSKAYFKRPQNAKSK